MLFALINATVAEVIAIESSTTIERDGARWWLVFHGRAWPSPKIFRR